MIHAYALEPEVVATWGKIEQFRFFHDKFGLGTPRALLELPKYGRWKKAVYEAAKALLLSEKDMLRIQELFRLFEENKCRRTDSHYDGLVSWLENAETEYDRRPFAAIIARQNPRSHRAVLTADQLDNSPESLRLSTGMTIDRSAAAMAGVVSSMLSNCRELHLVDPYFNPSVGRYRRVIQALADLVARNGRLPNVIRVHCSDNLGLGHFSAGAAATAILLPTGITVEFCRLRERPGGDILHNRFILTDLGGVQFPAGLDESAPGATDDVTLLTREQFVKRWSQFAVGDGSYEVVDTPDPVCGTRMV